MVITTKFNSSEEVCFLQDGVVKYGRVIALKYDSFPISPEVEYRVACTNCIGKDEYMTLPESRIFKNKEELIRSL